MTKLFETFTVSSNEQTILEIVKENQAFCVVYHKADENILFESFETFDIKKKKELEIVYFDCVIKHCMEYNYFYTLYYILENYPEIIKPFVLGYITKSIANSVRCEGNYNSINLINTLSKNLETLIKNKDLKNQKYTKEDSIKFIIILINNVLSFEKCFFNSDLPHIEMRLLELLFVIQNHHLYTSLINCDLHLIVEFCISKIVDCHTYNFIEYTNFYKCQSHLNKEIMFRSFLCLFKDPYDLIGNNSSRIDVFSYKSFMMVCKLIIDKIGYLKADKILNKIEDTSMKYLIPLMIVEGYKESREEISKNENDGYIEYIKGYMYPDCEPRMFKFDEENLDNNSFQITKMKYFIECKKYIASKKKLSSDIFSTIILLEDGYYNFKE